MIAPRNYGDMWKGKVVPLQWCFGSFPATAKAVLSIFGKRHWRNAIQSFPDDAMLWRFVATAGLSHQVIGERCGFNE